jgi:hypothetical protein
MLIEVDDMEPKVLSKAAAVIEVAPVLVLVAALALVIAQESTCECCAGVDVPGTDVCSALTLRRKRVSTAVVFLSKACSLTRKSAWHELAVLIDTFASSNILPSATDVRM